MTTRTRALAAIVLALLVFDVLLTVISCQRRNTQPSAPGQPSNPPTVTRELIVVGPIVTYTPSPTRTPAQLAPPSMTVTPSITPSVRAIRESPTLTAIATILPQTLPRTGGCTTGGCN